MALQELWLLWQRALIQGGQGGYLERSHVPHVTLADGQPTSIQRASIQPVSWA